MAQEVLAMFVLIGSGLLAGEILMVAVALVPAERTLEPLAYARWHTTFSHYMDRFTPYVAMTTMVLAAVFCLVSTPGMVRYLMMAGASAILSLAFFAWAQTIAR